MICRLIRLHCSKYEDCTSANRRLLAVEYRGRGVRPHFVACRRVEEDHNTRTSHTQTTHHTPHVCTNVRTHRCQPLSTNACPTCCAHLTPSSTTRRRSGRPSSTESRSFHRYIYVYILLTVYRGAAPASERAPARCSYCVPGIEEEKGRRS